MTNSSDPNKNASQARSYKRREALGLFGAAAGVIATGATAPSVLAQQSFSSVDSLLFLQGQ